MEAKARCRPGLPHVSPLTSYWQLRDTNVNCKPTRDFDSDISHAGQRQRSQHHIGSRNVPYAHRYDRPDLPRRAEHVVIGSGISGACVAYNLLQAPATNVVMLEARGACDGATGRNGGHTKCASYTTFPRREEQCGFEEACKIAALEQTNVRETHRFIRDHDIACDQHICNTVDIFYDVADWEACRGVAGRLNGSVPSAEKYTIVEAEEARTRYRTPTAVGALEFPGGSLNSYKLATAILGLALDRGLELHTHTAVLNVQPTTDTDTDTNTDTNTGLHTGIGGGSGYYRWRVSTARGDVLARNVIFCTNGYTARLLPELQGSILPLRGQVTAQRPGSGMPSGGLAMTYSFRHAEGYEYMISRQAGAEFAGDIVIGGGLGQVPDGGVSEFGETDDSVLNAAASRWLHGALVNYFGAANWGADDAQGRVRCEWTGIMGYTADGMPYVGPLQRAGIWVCAGFNGRGMTLCFKCAEAVAVMAKRGSAAAAPDWLPRSFLPGVARLALEFRGLRRPPALKSRTDTGNS